MKLKELAEINGIEVNSIKELVNKGNNLYIMRFAINLTDDLLKHYRNLFLSFGIDNILFVGRHEDVEIYELVKENDNE